MLIFEILPKNHLVFVNASSLMISGYSLYLSFDSNIDPSSISTLGICDVGIFVSKKISAVQVHFDTLSFKDHVWVSINLQGHDKLLNGCIYHSPSTNMDASISSLFITGLFARFYSPPNMWRLYHERGKLVQYASISKKLLH